MGAVCCKEEAIDFDGEIELSHFHLLRSVGKGAFGKVRVVQHKKTKEIYALKYINKAKCIRMRAVENIIQERRLLEEVEFSLLCNLRYAFQDDENLFMVLDLMLGGDLRFHLERAGPMKEDVVRFYVAELALALNALHSRRVIHRDLKPDNVLLDEHGHAHLTDFNIAVYYNPSKPLLSIAGSMAYMAPEVLLRKGYLASVDWWSLGVVMFELLFGKRPFRGKTNDLLTNSILRDPLPFPENAREIVSAPCMDVLSRLCERDISKRLGCTPEGLDAIKNHPWFNGIDWEKLISKEATPPFQPDSKRANFDATHELEELLMEDNPLKAKKRAQTSPETELSTEMQMMEDRFTVYDFNKVRRSHSLNRGRILRPSNDPKMSSGTLDGVVRRTGSGRVDNIQTQTLSPVHKAYRADSPSDRVGQDRFNPDEDQVSLVNSGFRRSPLGSPASSSPLSQRYAQDDAYRYNGPSTNNHAGRIDGERAEFYQMQKQTQPLESQRLDGILHSEAIVLPPSSLPRPLQPRDDNTSYRGGLPRHYKTGTSAPSSPASVFAPTTISTLASSSSAYGTSSPVSEYSFTQPQPQHVVHERDNYNCSSNAVAPSPESLTVSPPPVARRAVRGRDSLDYPINSMPAAVPSSAVSVPSSPSDTNLTRTTYAQRGNRLLDQQQQQQQYPYHHRQASYPQSQSQPVKLVNAHTVEDRSAGQSNMYR